MRQILIIQTAFVGDLLLGIPLLKRLRKLEPNSHLTLYCRKGLGDFLLRAGLVDDVVEVDKASKQSRSEASDALKSRNWDWVVCPHQSISSLLLTAGLKAPRKTGYRSLASRLVFNDVVARPHKLPEALRQLCLIAKYDSLVHNALTAYSKELEAENQRQTRPLATLAVTPVPNWASMELEHFARIHRASQAEQKTLLSARAREVAERFELFGSQPLAFLAPGSVWPTKMWTQEGYIEAARELRARGWKVALIGAKSEAQICHEIADHAKGAIVLAGESSLWESGELLALAKLLICNDSGAMHIASTCGVPSVALFGPTTLALGYRPWQNDARVVQTEMACRPCGKHGAKVCPLGTHACMTSVSSHEVLNEAFGLVGESRS